MPLIPAPTIITSPNLSSSGPRARCPTVACACSIARSSVCATAWFLLNGFADDFGDVLHLDRIAAFRVQLAVFEVGDAVRAGRGQHLRPGLQRLRQAQIGEALALGRLHPD